MDAGDIRMAGDVRRLPFTVKDDLRRNSPSASSPCPARRSPACTARPARPASPPSSPTPAATSTRGPASSRASPPRGETRRARCCSSGTSAPTSSSAPPRTPCTSPRWPGPKGSVRGPSRSILAFDNYGLSEVIGPGVSGECAAREGMHVSEDHFLVECLHPETLEPVPDGETGELVFTTLTKEALPVLRYRTRDLAALDRRPCPCGRTGVRMSRVVVKVEVRREDFSDELRHMIELRDRIDREIHAVTGVRMAVELVAPNTIGRSEGKARRVVDHRPR